MTGLGAAFAAVLALAALGARAELVSVEAVGVAPASAEARDAALRSGVSEAVLRVAAELAREGGASSDDPAVLGTALGPDPFLYAVRFQIAEDRGERPAQLVQEPGVEREHVVIVRAQIERARIRERLARAGLLGAAGSRGARTVSLVLAGIETHATWERLRRALGARGGAVRTLEFAPGAVTAELETDESNEALVARLQRALRDRLALAAEASEGPELRLRVRALPSSPEETEAEGAPEGAPGPPPI